MADVFVSYAREDRARADLVARNLAAMGIEVFWDSEIPPGQTWADYVEAKLSKCKAVVVLWSETSTKSQWVREEARMGRDRGKLIPAMIDGSVAPFGFGEVQAANLSTWNGEPDHAEWRRFAEAVRNAAGAPVHNAPPPTPQPMPARPATVPPPTVAPPQAFASAPAASNVIPGAQHGVKPIWIIGGMAALAAVLVIAYLLGRNPNPPPQPQPDTVVTTTDAPAPSNDGSPQAIILAQLQGDQQALSQQGFQMVSQPATGGLAQGQTWNMPVQLVPGVDYRLVGVCDRDCSDLDLVLLDQQGNIVTQDTATDDHPVVSVQTQYAGNYVIEVRMYQCSVAPCYYAVALYGRR
ncbi:MAG TPA: toll/interleukin-1 receptor domain-containing protein [Caulobacterales bacterium]|nr:toll/interleukin-1 receptor domain-containing protein [Caulobacterales bacterium]